MNDLLFHSAPAVARELSERLVVLLGNLSSDEASRLRRMLVLEEHERPRMVLTGQYSSGKSTLIKALTDDAAQVVIDSAVATDSVEVFDWDGLVDLVDTPGVQAGLLEHDELAEKALRTADLVLFAVTVDLFDDRLVEHMRHATEDLRKAPQLLVVVTKCRSLVAADGVREAAVREALGSSADQVPWVECDAKTYLGGWCGTSDLGWQLAATGRHRSWFVRRVPGGRASWSAGGTSDERWPGLKRSPEMADRHARKTPAT